MWRKASAAVWHPQMFDPPTPPCKVSNFIPPLAWKDAWTEWTQASETGKMLRMLRDFPRRNHRLLVYNIYIYICYIFLHLILAHLRLMLPFLACPALPGDRMPGGPKLCCACGVPTGQDHGRSSLCKNCISHHVNILSTIIILFFFFIMIIILLFFFIIMIIIIIKNNIKIIISTSYQILASNLEKYTLWGKVNSRKKKGGPPFIFAKCVSYLIY